MHGLIHLLQEPLIRDSLLNESWKRLFTQRTLQRARDYSGPDYILSAEVSRRSNNLIVIEGTVRGNYRSNYSVSVEFEKTPHGFRSFAECSCPVAYQCKHCAALVQHTVAQLALATTSTEGVEPMIDFWLNSLQESKPDSTLPSKTTPNKHFLAYCICWPVGIHDRPELSLHVGRHLKSGEIRINTKSHAQTSLSNPPQYFDRADIIPTLLFQQLAPTSYGALPSRLPLKGTQAYTLLQEALDTERLFALGASDDPALVRNGEALPISLTWKPLPNGGSQPTLGLPPGSLLIPTTPLLVLVPPNGQSHTTLHPVLTNGHSVSLITNWAKGPTIFSKDVAKLSHKLAALPQPLPAPAKVETKTLPKVKPTPRLTLHRKNPFKHGGVHLSGQPEPIVAELEFLYHGHPAPPNAQGQAKKLPPFTVSTGKSLLSVPRDKSGELKLVETLRSGLGIQLASYTDPVPPSNLTCFIPNADPRDWDLAWAEIIANSLPALREIGWDIIIDTSAKIELYAIGPDNLDTGLTELPDHGIDWFQFDASYLTPSGEKQSLLPLLSAFLQKSDPAIFEESIDGVAEDHETILRDPESAGFVSINTKRLLSLAKSIYDLFGFSPPDEPLHRIQAADLAESLDIDGSDTLRALAELGRKLKSVSSLPKPAIPKSITAKLRDYQTDGFHWMQFLARHSLHGILADDMGLGKTLQALCHIQAEVSGRRTKKRPTLVVAPTSVTGNWAVEAKKFAPKLKVLLLQGPERKERFHLIPKHHLILTSYALLPRDFEELSKHQFHLLVLDEAQYIKNPAAKVAQLVCKLDAAHRMSLSGTPLENHLGELWSQMRFLMPGLLGSSKQFHKNFRSPIERDQDSSAQLSLNRRVAPLLLRRTKEEVATELPKKTEIIHTIPLHQKQIDLYETVRAVMDKRVREAITDKGLAKSHIIVLDALLKLRQICCHPQLLKLPAAKKVTQSAKLDFLTKDLLPTLLEEDRRILLFSSFTSMLALIEQHLNENGIPFAKITGNTKDRQAQVEEFQKGDLPVFLISLKAGGTGLNLTAADTVIHYDPWWNPSAENQATDRAHRIGQTKPVFVHKLISEGSIEQRIQELQAKKAALVEALLTADTSRLRIDQSTLNNLLAPLPQG